MKTILELIGAVIGVCFLCWVLWFITVGTVGYIYDLEVVNGMGGFQTQSE